MMSEDRCEDSMPGRRRGQSLNMGMARTHLPNTSSATSEQGLALSHFSAQLEQCLTHKSTLHLLNTPLTRATQPLRAPRIP
jgi:hypothetical protein